MDSAVFKLWFLGVGGLKVLKKLPLLQSDSNFCLILSRFLVPSYSNTSSNRILTRLELLSSLHPLSAHCTISFLIGISKVLTSGQ